MIKLVLLILCCSIVILFSCKKDISPGNDPNFKVQSNTDKGFEHFEKKVIVFNIPIYAVYKVSNKKLLHAANIMAQYLDNNEDGVVDNNLVLDEMIASNAFVVMWNKEKDLNKVNLPNENDIGQDLGNDETEPDWHVNGYTGKFDAAIEELWHIISHAGYANAYPDIFGEYAGTMLTNAMDVARGGHFATIPNQYPGEAWYSYDDATCEYDCMATEYFYWALSSKLGAQKNRFKEINNEWKLNTDMLLKNTDSLIYALLSDTSYHLPQVLPDGSYKH